MGRAVAVTRTTATVVSWRHHEYDSPQDLSLRVVKKSSLISLPPHDSDPFFALKKLEDRKKKQQDE
ncbi:hypothetical protein E2C01_054309 [Portunus trituberculatus]|uniref:Uncharacterized protein n=1 Tax=Portunus trituberculatus TaxID=210409 RepID=A0A5B7GJ05_PORTR|nr:hypothetical protein [Portunus trituberculatus]